MVSKLTACATQEGDEGHGKHSAEFDGDAKQFAGADGAPAQLYFSTRVCGAGRARCADHALDLETGRCNCRRVVGIAAGAIAENRAAMGTRRDPSAWQVHRLARAGSVLDYSLC